MTETIEHEGWTFTVREGELLVTDDVLAEHLEIHRNKLRQLIRTHAKPANIQPVSILYPSGTKSRGRPGQGFLLTCEDALFLVTQSSAPKALALTKAMIRIFIAVQLKLQAPPEVPTAPALDELDRKMLIEDARHEARVRRAQAFERRLEQYWGGNEAIYQLVLRAYNRRVAEALEGTVHHVEDGATVREILIRLHERTGAIGPGTGNAPPSPQLAALISFLLAAAARERELHGQHGLKLRYCDALRLMVWRAFPDPQAQPPIVQRGSPDDSAPCE